MRQHRTYVTPAQVTPLTRSRTSQLTTGGTAPWINVAGAVVRRWDRASPRERGNHQRWWPAQGVVTERRFVTPSGLEAEINIGSRDWAKTDPVDPGTRRVVSDGAVLYDPEGLLAHLVRVCA